MEPMDLDWDDLPSWNERKDQSSIFSNVSDMEIDTSPLKHSQNSQIENQDHFSSTAMFPQITSSGWGHKHEGSSLRATKSVNNRATKTGYGIPDDDTTFSHFPEKGKKLSSTGLICRKTAKASQRSERVKPEPVTCVRLASKKDHYFKSCCRFMFNMFKILMFCGIILILIMYFVKIHREKCQQSRQFNSKALKTDLETLVFGQHFASEIIPTEMELYFKKFQNLHPASTLNGSKINSVVVCKPLILSFHGWTGVGKNFISKIISDSFTFSVVNHIVIPMHFPHEAFEHRYGQIIQDWLVTNNTVCTVNIIVMDEMDKAFSPVTEGIIGAIEALSQPCHIATPTIILLLSNSFATDINRLFFKLATEKENREDIPVTSFLPLFSQKANGSWNSMLDRKSLIDAYVPFLPLERKHVSQCIKRDLVSKRFSTDSEAVEKIMSELTFTSVAGLEISTTGCKRVADKVDYVMLSL